MNDTVSHLITARDAGAEKPTNGSSTGAFANLRAAADQFVTRSLTADASLPSNFDWVASQMHGINHCVFKAEAAGVEKGAILDTLTGVREIQALSPFVSRLQNWPAAIILKPI